MKMLCTSRHLLHHLFDISSSSRSSGQGTALVQPVIGAFSTWPISCHFTPAVILFVSAVVLMGLIYWLIYKTAYGRAVRAIATNRKAAQLMGINVARMSSTVFILTSAFDGLVAFFIAASLHQITPGFGLWATVKGLIVMILGGIGSIPGAIIGGLLLGVIELQALWYLGGGYRDLVAFLVLFVFLVVRPRGILGAGEARE